MGPVCVEFTDRFSPQKASNAKLWCAFILNQLLVKRIKKASDRPVY